MSNSGLLRYITTSAKINLATKTPHVDVRKGAQVGVYLCQVQLSTTFELR